MKESTRRSQLRRTFKAFKDKAKTMKQVSVETGIMRPNICRYVATLRKRDKIALVKTGRCPITKHEAQFLTTDPTIVEKIHNQVELAV